MLFKNRLFSVLATSFLTCLSLLAAAQSAKATELIDDHSQYVLAVSPSSMGVTDAKLKEIVTNAGGAVVGSVGDFNPFPKAVIAKCNPAAYQQFLQRVVQDGTYYAAFPDYRYSYQNVSTSSLVPPKDPYYPSQTHLAQMNVGKAWKHLRDTGKTTIPAITVALFDDCKNVYAVNYDLQNKFHKQGFNAATNQAASFTYGIGEQHPATMASIICGATNTIATVGVNPAANIYPVACGANGTVRESTLMRGIEHCAKKGIRLLCLGVNGGFGAKNNMNLLQQNYQNSQGYGVPILEGYFHTFTDKYNGMAVLPSGNDGKEVVDYIVSFQAIGIGSGVVVDALNSTNTELASFSNREYNHLRAPGQNIATTDHYGRVVSVSGTCAAAANLTGVAALMMSVNPNLSGWQMRQKLQQSGQGTTTKCVDALKVVQSL